ncbi:uncharacterized protein LOC124898570 [Capsicum annuum]|uniref:uncharacterized protein LOC124898570 n=1 Tax=Capsicum annuum TaxID=4072 RepID=UPI001FB0C667|nr:uncharacterized protein LOC124898570 [Capsicum annuum]
MIQHPDQSYIDPLETSLKEKPAHYTHVEEEPNGNPWYYVMKRAVTKKVVTDFIRNNLICRFRVPELIITDNGFKIVHRNSTAYRPQMNEVVEAANKNIKKILRKIIENDRLWHKMLPYALLGYRTMVRTSIGVTPYLLVYRNKAVIPAEVEIPSLRIIQEAGLSNEEWVRARYE